MREISYAEALNESISQEIDNNEKIFMVGEDIGLYGGAFGVSAGLIEKHGKDKIIDTPISEQGIINVAIGSALLGMRPVAEIMFSDFLLMSFDQIANQAAKIRYMFGGQAMVPLTIRAPIGAGLGIAAQHSQSIEALFLHIPGLKVVMPSSAYDAKGLLASSIKDNNPVIFLEHKLLYKTKGEVPEERYEIPIGVGEIKKEGNDVTLVATSYMVTKALKVAEKLDKENISVEVIDPRSIKPLDLDLIVKSVKKTNHIVLLEEACYTGGFSCFLAAEINKYCFDYLNAPIIRVTGLDCPIPYEHNLENEVIPDEPKIENGINEVLGRS